MRNLAIKIRSILPTFYIVSGKIIRTLVNVITCLRKCTFSLNKKQILIFKDKTNKYYRSLDPLWSSGSVLLDFVKSLISVYFESRFNDLIDGNLFSIRHS